MSTDLWEEGAWVATSHTVVWLLGSEASFWLADADVLQIFFFMGACEESSECLLKSSSV